MRHREFLPSRMRILVRWQKPPSSHCLSIRRCPRLEKWDGQGRPSRQIPHRRMRIHLRLSQLRSSPCHRGWGRFLQPVRLGTPSWKVPVEAMDSAPLDCRRSRHHRRRRHRRRRPPASSPWNQAFRKYRGRAWQGVRCRQPHKSPRHRRCRRRLEQRPTSNPGRWRWWSQPRQDRWSCPR